MEAVQDPALGVDEDEVGIPSHQLRRQALFRGLPQLVQAGKGEEEDPVPLRLLQAQEPSPRQVLPEEHAEHGGLRRVLPLLRGDMHPGGAAPGAEQQPLGAAAPPKVQEEHVPLRLLDLVHPGQQELLPELLQSLR